MKLNMNQNLSISGNMGTMYLSKFRRLFAYVYWRNICCQHSTTPCQLIIDYRCSKHMILIFDRSTFDWIIALFWWRLLFIKPRSFMPGKIANSQHVRNLSKPDPTGLPCIPPRPLPPFSFKIKERMPLILFHLWRSIQCHEPEPIHTLSVPPHYSCGQQDVTSSA